MHRRHDEPEGIAGSDTDAAIRAYCQRKYKSDFARELNRSVRQYLKQFTAAK